MGSRCYRRATQYGSGGGLLIHERIAEALASAAGMKQIEALTDAEIAEAHKSATIFDGVTIQTAPLVAFLSLLHALKWINLRDKADKLALGAYFDGTLGDIFRIAQGREEPITRFETGQRFARILREVRELVAEQGFLHWQVAFPGVWDDWEHKELVGGFDAVVGNPPWDRMKLQQVEWFAARRPTIAHAQRASDRQAMVAQLVKAGDALAVDFFKASNRAEMASRAARNGGDYPLLSGGDTNINSLFIERAKALCKPDGMVGLLVPSGIATETSSQEFFAQLIENRSVKCVYDFFNKRTDGGLFFPDVYYRFKFSVFVFSPIATKFRGCKFASFVRDVANLKADGVTFEMTPEHFALVNPNSRTAPIYRAGRDKEISTTIYRQFPILVDKSGEKETRVWPVRYMTMFHMANESGQFRTRSELEEQEGAFAVAGNRFRSADGDWVPLYEGKMVQAYDHRASSIVTVAANVHRSGQGLKASTEDHQDPNFVPEPRYFVKDTGELKVEIALKDVTSTTNARSIIACMIPPVAAGHTLPLIQMRTEGEAERACEQICLLGNLNSVPLDFVARTKILSNHASWYIIEQLPVISQARHEAMRFGNKTSAEIVGEAGLELTYTAHDMAPFARALDYVDGDGVARPPFLWDEDRRLHLQAKLDAVYFHLYGITDRETVRYIYSTFPIVESEEIAVWGRYRSRDLCLAYMNALAAGHPDALVEG